MRKKPAHTHRHTHIGVQYVVAGLLRSRSCGCFQEECWLFHKPVQNQNATTTARPHGSVCLTFISEERLFGSMCDEMALGLLACRTGCYTLLALYKKWLNTFLTFSSCIKASVRLLYQKELPAQPVMPERIIYQPIMQINLTSYQSAGKTLVVSNIPRSAWMWSETWCCCNTWTDSFVSWGDFGVDMPILAVLERENKHREEVKVQRENVMQWTLCLTQSIYSPSQPRPFPPDLSADLIPTWSQEYVNILVPTSACTAQCGASDWKLKQLLAVVQW